MSLVVACLGMAVQGARAGVSRDARLGRGRERRTFGWRPGDTGDRRGPQGVHDFRRGDTRCRVGINLRTNPTPEQPYPATYYPGTSKESEAGEIVFDAERSLRSYDFQVLRQFRTRTVLTGVRDEGGSPLACVELSASLRGDGESYPRGIRTNALGEAELQLLDGVRYEIFPLKYDPVSKTIRYGEFFVIPRGPGGAIRDIVLFVREFLREGHLTPLSPSRFNGDRVLR